MAKENIVSNYLISIHELYELLGNENTIIIDTREPEDYVIDHIPGAVNVYDIFTYLSTKENGGYEVMRNHFAKVFGEIGISESKRVIIYEDAMDNGYGRSCRGYFILNHLGHKNVTVLHGGYQAWINEKMPVVKEFPKSEKENFVLNVDNSIIISHEEMLKAISDPSIIILDCRDHAEWVAISSSPYGPDFTPRKGRIPGAVWLEWYNTMFYKNNIPWFKEPEELKNVFANVGITEDSNVYVYCFKGARTSNTFMALRMAGIKNIRNYFGSWNEWSRDFSLPIEKGYPKSKN